MSAIEKPVNQDLRNPDTFPLQLSNPEQVLLDIKNLLTGVNIDRVDIIIPEKGVYQIKIDELEEVLTVISLNLQDIDQIWISILPRTVQEMIYPTPPEGDVESERYEVLEWMNAHQLLLGLKDEQYDNLDLGRETAIEIPGFDKKVSEVNKMMIDRYGGTKEGTSKDIMDKYVEAVYLLHGMTYKPEDTDSELRDNDQIKQVFQRKLEERFPNPESGARIMADAMVKGTNYGERKSPLVDFAADMRLLLKWAEAIEGKHEILKRIVLQYLANIKVWVERKEIDRKPGPPIGFEETGELVDLRFSSVMESVVQILADEDVSTLTQEVEAIKITGEVSEIMDDYVALEDQVTQELLEFIRGKLEQTGVKASPDFLLKYLKSVEVDLNNLEEVGKAIDQALAA